MKALRRTIPTIIALLMAGVAQPSSAIWDTWTGGDSGSWTNAANWNKNRSPGDTSNGGSDEDSAVIRNGTATLDAPSFALRNVFIAPDSGETGTLVVATGGIITSTKYDSLIGREGNGTVIQNGGSWNGSAEDIKLGEKPGSSGSWIMSAGVLSNCVLYIGNDNSTGHFQITGPSARVEKLTNDSYIGYTNSANGQITQSSGTWDNSGRHLFFGYDASSSGTWIMSGGMLTNFNNLYIGTDGNGYFELSGTGLVVCSANTGTPLVGRNSGSTGTVVQTGGTWNNSGRQLHIGDRQGAVGSWNLSSGTLTKVGILQIGHYGTGTFYLSGDGLICDNTSDIRVGNTGYSSGTFIQTGGTLNANGHTISIGTDTNTVGVYHISDGVITNVYKLLCGNNGTGTLIIEGADASISVKLFSIGSTNDTFQVAPDDGGITPINSSGAVELNGTLDVDFENYDMHSRELVLINCYSHSGTFAAVNLTAEWSAEVDYSSPTEVKLINIKSPPTGFILMVK